MNDFTVQKHLAFVNIVEAGQAVEESRLAAPAGPHDGDHLPPGDLKVDTPQGLNLQGGRAVHLGDAPCVDYRVVHGGRVYSLGLKASAGASEEARRAGARVNASEARYTAAASKARLAAGKTKPPPISSLNKYW